HGNQRNKSSSKICLCFSCCIFKISHCRYCFNIGREHRSNGVYWVQELLFDIVNEAKTTNEIEIQKRLRQCRRRSAAVEAQALKESRQSFELTDEELLKAFTDAKD
ncbi:unnamed protein product, partial [Gongylonema pulchrum]|uniref:Ovule protein n=1 Tax=Gongylonema pulchrum TaxID=637853 RepID=A0A183END6_9BILA